MYKVELEISPNQEEYGETYHQSFMCESHELKEGCLILYRVQLLPAGWYHEEVGIPLGPTIKWYVGEGTNEPTW